MKKLNYFSISIITILLITVLLLAAPTLAGTPALNKPSINLHIEQGYNLKIKGLDKNFTVQWSAGNKKIATVSSKGFIRGQANGKTVIYAKIYNKNKLKYSLKADVKVDKKGYAATLASFISLLKNSKVSDIIVNGKADFTVPNGFFGKNVESTGNSLSLKVSAGSSLNSVKIVGTKSAKINILGQLSSLCAKTDNTKIGLKTSAGNNMVHTIFLENPTNLDFVSNSKKEPCHIYVLKKSDIKISGKNKNKDIIAIKNTAEETKITADKIIELFADARTTLVVNTGAKNSKITTLNYRTPVTVTNNTDTALTVTTPSVDKTVEAGETHTITGKN